MSYFFILDVGLHTLANSSDLRIVAKISIPLIPDLCALKSIVRSKILLLLILQSRDVTQRVESK